MGIHLLAADVKLPKYITTVYKIYVVWGCGAPTHTHLHIHDETIPHWLAGASLMLECKVLAKVAWKQPVNEVLPRKGIIISIII